MEFVPVREAVWQLICSQPQIYQCDDFLTSDECAAILRLAKASLPAKCFSKIRIDLDTNPQGALAAAQPKDAAVLRAVERRVWALSAAPHEGEMPWAVHFTPPEAPEKLENRMTLGLHVDSNNGRERRYLTFLIYLHSTPPSEGGHTVFPLAQLPGKQAAPLQLGQMLLESVQHTGQAYSLEQTAQVQEAANALLAHAEHVAAIAAAGPGGPDAGLAVAAKEGRCLAFWSRDAKGHLNAASWHGGAAVFSTNTASGKWTLQKFCEAPVSTLKDCCIETFASRHHHLRLPCFAGGVRFVDEEDADDSIASPTAKDAARQKWNFASTRAANLVDRSDWKSIATKC